MVKEEDAHEFDVLYRRLSPRVMGQAYAMTGSRAAAEDLIQEAFGPRGPMEPCTWAPESRGVDQAGHVEPGHQ